MGYGVMKFRDYRIIMILLLAAIMATVIAIIMNMPLPVIIFLVGAMALGTIALFTFRQRVEDPLYDERTLYINAKASSATIRIFCMMSLLVGLTLLLMDIMGYTGYAQTGITLFFMVSIVLVLHLVFRRYYRRKYGG